MSFPAARKIGAGRHGDALQGQNRRAGTLMNVSMADWSEGELVELGPVLPRHIEASLTRRPDGQTTACARCGTSFGNHPGRGFRLYPMCGRKGCERPARACDGKGQRSHDRTQNLETALACGAGAG